MDKKYAGTRLFTGRTEEDAVSQWKFSDHREMFRKHDFYKFCNRVYRDNNERFPDDDVQPPPPGRDERDGRDGRPPGRG